jgi:uncharacterized membrane protein
MPSFVPPIPQANRSGSGGEPAFNTPVRWTLRVLAWLAFAVASYLAWHALNQTAVAGCAVGSDTGCDLVLNSSWSKWLGIPVTFLGLGCYATLAALSVLLGVRHPQVNRWATTAFVMLAVTAAGASLWFIGIQIFAISSFCPYCLVVDACGIALGVIATVFGMRAALAERNQAQPRVLQAGLIGMRTPRTTASLSPSPAFRTEPASPAMIPALAGAIPLVALLAGGQILFPSSTFDVQKGQLTQSIQMVGAKAADVNHTSANQEPHVAMRVPTESTVDEQAADTSEPSRTSATAEPVAKNDSAAAPVSEPAPPAKQRLVKFLGGKLTLDVYQHPMIGSPEAPHIVIEMVSYDCSHCRQIAPLVNRALERYGDQVALLVMIQPLDKECNKLVTNSAASHQGACTVARLGLGIAKLNPAAFADFHEFMMSGSKETPPRMEAVIPKAYVFADRSQLRELTKSQELEKQLDGYIDLYGQLQRQNQANKNFGLPVQILGDFIMTGQVEKEEDLFKAWEQHLGVKPQ